LRFEINDAVDDGIFTLALATIQRAFIFRDVSRTARWATPKRGVELRQAGF
jgi:hypothetical protein